jgi:toxin ParE1/3/4
MYQYRLMPSAVQDLQEIADYIAEQLSAPESAIRLLKKVEEAIRSACAFPLSLPLVNDELLRMKGYRKILVDNYIVFVLPDQKNEALNVMRVLYYARDYFKDVFVNKKVLQKGVKKVSTFNTQ